MQLPASRGRAGSLGRPAHRAGSAASHTARGGRPRRSPRPPRRGPRRRRRRTRRGRRSRSQTQPSDRPADRRAAEEHDRLQGEHPAAHRRVGAQLHDRGRRGHEHDAGEPDAARRTGRRTARFGRRRRSMQHRRRRTAAAPTTTSWTSIVVAAGGGQRARRASRRETTEYSRVKVVSAPCERLLDEQRHDHVEVERERADDRHHHQRHPQLGHRCGRSAGRRGPGPCASAATGEARSSLVRIMQQADDHGDVGDAVDGEAPAVADGDDQQAGQRRADDARAGHQRAVEADRVLDVVLGHHLDDERAAGRVVEGGGDAADAAPRRRSTSTGGSPLKARAASANDCSMANDLDDHQQLALVACGRRRARPRRRAAAPGRTGRR